MTHADYQQMTFDKLRVRIFPDIKSMGQAAADFTEQKLTAIIGKKKRASIIIATGASQFTFYEALRKKQDIAWNKVKIFHLDEYVGMNDRHPASFRKYLKERILNYIDPLEIHLLQGDAHQVEAEGARYEALLQNEEIDLACIGIGENGHIAFNDPPVADFRDPKLVKVVKLDKACRQQQLGEGWFPTLADVPEYALSLTVSGIMRAKAISCVVPDLRKAEAVKNALKGPVSEKCPASILRTHDDCTLFLDKNAASELV